MQYACRIINVSHCFIIHYTVYSHRMTCRNNALLHSLVEISKMHNITVFYVMCPIVKLIETLISHNMYN